MKAIDAASARQDVSCDVMLLGELCNSESSFIVYFKSFLRVELSTWVIGKRCQVKYCVNTVKNLWFEPSYIIFHESYLIQNIFDSVFPEEESVKDCDVV